jgi:signal transduction histidine kinase/ActR/RegA family two-component response regulator
MNRKDLIDKPLNTAYVIEDRAQALDLFIQRFRLRSIRKKFEQELNLYDGSWIWVEFTNSFIEIKNSPALLLSILRDITSYKKLIKETIEAKEKAEEMNKVKSFFFANMSHELRTPLVGILGFADILKDELEDNPDLAKMAELICKSGQRLHETLNHILNLSKLEAGKIEIKLVEEDIVPHLKNSFLLFEQSARNKGLNYKLELPEKKVICRIDKNLIQNIFNNLINNAIKFTNEGSVTVKLDSYGYIARIQIIDTGIGISEENHSVIWEEFRQVSEGLNRNFEGTGLGLTIVKKFTAVMGGKVSLESKVGKGSNFILEFPLVDKKLEKQINGVSNSTKNNSDIIKAKTSYEILYVEDDQSSVDLVSLMLKNNYYCDVARTPEEALNKVKQNYYKAILMDINLKTGIDGVKLTSLIRQIDGYKNIPIAAITAYALEKDKENFLSQGLTHYLAKPFSKTELINLLKNMLDDSAS